MPQKKRKICPPTKIAIDLERQSVRQDLEICLTEMTAEMAQRLRLDYVSASFFRGSSCFIDSIEVGDIKVFEDSQISSAILKHEGGLFTSAVDKENKFLEGTFAADRARIKSCIGIAIKNRENDVIGVICGFVCSDYRISSETRNMLKYYAARAAATLEIVNTSETLKCIKTIQDVISILDELMKLGYKELTEYLLNQVHNIFL